MGEISRNPPLSLFGMTMDAFGMEERRVKLKQMKRAIIKGQTCISPAIQLVIA
jgi:hypothetical protein